MERIMANVKPKRRYNSSGRQAQARRNREAILDAAQRQFLAGGYAATTIAAIAAEAGVSVETIYKAFGGKPGLVRAIYQRGLTGREPIPAFQRSDAMRERETDPRTIMRNWGVLTSEVSSVVSPILLLVRSAAATDPDMAALLNDSNHDRDERARHHVNLHLTRALRPARPAARLVPAAIRTVPRRLHDHRAPPPGPVNDARLPCWSSAPGPQPARITSEVVDA